MFGDFGARDLLFIAAREQGSAVCLADVTEGGLLVQLQWRLMGGNHSSVSNIRDSPAFS